MKDYTELWNLLEKTGVRAERSGPPEEFKGKQVYIIVSDEQGSRNGGVKLYFDIDGNGNESFVCQE